jgi:GNAT superfamily N-acetyltransferase
VITTRIEPMPPAELTAWRASRSAGDVPLPDPTPDADVEAVTVSVDDVRVGGALLEHREDAGRPLCVVRVLQTTLPDDAPEHWSATIAALESYARARGAAVLTTAVAPALASFFGAAGFRATMTTVGKRLDPGSAPELQEDRRVAVRPMAYDERAQFAVDAIEQLRTGMARAGVADRESARLDELEARLGRLVDDPPDDELLMTGTVEGVAIGRAWATLVERDGALDFHGNTIDLFPEFRGQRLTPSFLGALRRHVHEIGIREVHLRVYGHDAGARRTFLQHGAGVEDVHLRKDLH